MTWVANRWHLTTVTMYNESDPIMADSGLISRSKGTDVSLKITLLRLGDMMFYGEHGRFVEHGVVFQISKKELDDNSFTITSGKTFVVIGGDTYRIMSVMDYTSTKHTLLIQCKAVRIINAD